MPFGLKKSHFAGWIALIILSLFLSVMMFIIALSAVPPREALKEVRGQVSACTVREGADDRYHLKAQLAGYDRALSFVEPQNKIEAVYSGLQVGANVVLLVEEGEKTATIWEGRSNGNVFLHYETRAQWEKSNNQWGLGLGLVFLGASGFFSWQIVKARKKSIA